MELNNNNAIDVLEDMEHRDIVAAYVDLYPPRIPRVYRDRSNPMEEYNYKRFNTFDDYLKIAIGKIFGSFRGHFDDEFRIL